MGGTFSRSPYLHHQILAVVTTVFQCGFRCNSDLCPHGNVYRSRLDGNLFQLRRRGGRRGISGSNADFYCSGEHHKWPPNSPPFDFIDSGQGDWALEPSSPYVYVSPGGNWTGNLLLSSNAPPVVPPLALGLVMGAQGPTLQVSGLLGHTMKSFMPRLIW
jgi:hypothetical protein